LIARCNFYARIARPAFWPGFSFVKAQNHLLIAPKACYLPVPILYRQSGFGAVENPRPWYF